MINQNMLSRLLGFPMEIPTNYPPCNIRNMGKDADGSNRYRIELAVAGFREEELNVTFDRGVLMIMGRKNESEYDETSYTVKGISYRDFVQKFYVNNDYEISDVSLENGLMTINLVEQRNQQNATKYQIGYKKGE